MVFRFAQVMCRWGRNRLGGSWAQECVSSARHRRKEGGSSGVLLPSGVARYRSGRCVGSHLRLVRRRSCPPILAFVHHSSRCAVLHCAALRDAVVRDGIAGPLESPTGSLNRRSCCQLDGWYFSRLSDWTDDSSWFDANLTTSENSSQLVHLTQITWSSGLRVSWGWKCHKCVACGSIGPNPAPVRERHSSRPRGNPRLAPRGDFTIAP